MGTRHTDCVIRWNDHQTLLSGVCTELLASERFTDVTLFCEGVTMKCHKFILSACSPYFEKILSEACCGDRYPVIFLKDVPFWEMQALLQFVYRGELTVDEARLADIIRLAKSLQIRGIGEFGTEATEQPRSTPKKKTKTEPPPLETEKQASPQLKDYSFSRTSFESLDSNINSLTERLLSFPPENQQLMAESLSTPLDASDYSLQETEVEYNFEPGPLEVNQPMCQQSLADYQQESDSSSQRRKDQNCQMESEAEMSSDASAQPSTNHVYRKYTEQNLLAAIKAVVCDGMRQAEASVRFSIPFTTLKRKIRTHNVSGGRLPIIHTKERPRIQDVTITNTLSVDNIPDAQIVTASENTAIVPDNRLSMVVRDSLDAVGPAPLFHSYKQYSESSLKEAISAVLENGMRATDAAGHFGIPLTTLMRKVRSHREALRCQGPPPLSSI